MVNFIVINKSEYEIDQINVQYTGEYSMDNQTANANNLTVLSDSDIPSNENVAQVVVHGTPLSDDEPTSIKAAGGEALIATLVTYTDPESGERVVTGFEAESENSEGNT